MVPDKIPLGVNIWVNVECHIHADIAQECLGNRFALVTLIRFIRAVRFRVVNIQFPFIRMASLHGKQSSGTAQYFSTGPAITKSKLLRILIRFKPECWMVTQ
ncbi:hypothetical protein C7P35_09165 [Salmonella enterica]|nr:hypothetical protein [Salmonella enterica]EAF5631402.1 hypothetical protein [Salmonella enterica subsp. enterica serovar Senftenberg]OQD47154.1 hypothetical protein BWZ29_23530 [Enterobacter cancerogenus]EAN3153391.1 hypothetical protein [Salmonella enterica]EAN5033753.1 hypothetical protein [Salmonella enterica subsp. enterica serovar Senftenberg]